MPSEANDAGSQIPDSGSKPLAASGIGHPVSGIAAIPSPDYDRQMTQKELAAWAGKCRQWVGKCCERGFVMIGGTASPRQLQGWLVRNPAPYSKEWRRYEEAA